MDGAGRRSAAELRAVRIRGVARRQSHGIRHRGAPDLRLRQREVPALVRRGFPGHVAVTGRIPEWILALARLRCRPARVDGQVRVCGPAALVDGDERGRMDRGEGRHRGHARARDGAGDRQPALGQSPGGRVQARGTARTAHATRGRRGDGSRAGSDRPSGYRVRELEGRPCHRRRNGGPIPERRGDCRRGEYPELRRRRGRLVGQVRRGSGDWQNQHVRRSREPHIRHGSGEGGAAVRARRESRLLVARRVPAGSRQGRVQSQLLVVYGRDGSGV